VQFDAHQDTWNPDSDRIDHGSFVARAVAEKFIDAARSIQIAVRTHAPADCGVEIVWGQEIATAGAAAVARRVVARVDRGPVYLSFDIDALDPAFAPGTGTPVAGGLSSREAIMILGALGPLDVVGMDVMEVAPPYDHADITALAGATMAMMMIGLIADKFR
jgi:agmatinase